MCGIAGLLCPRERDTQATRAQMERSIRVIAHRGPDDTVIHELPGLGAWGMVRLAIRDPSPAGRQPFVSGDVQVMFNGEIYNTDELRRELAGRGREFHTSCDTEVLLASYLEWGSDAFQRFDGIFAVAIVDRKRNRLVLARDEFGVKPLFVHEGRHSLAYASEPKSLREMGALDAGPDYRELERFLRYQYVPEPFTAWKGVRRLAPGTVEEFALDTLQRKRVLRFIQPASTDDDPSADWVERTDVALRCSVERQLISDRPIGVFLSGGIDSTLVSAYAADKHPGVRAFGISIDWEGDEQKWIIEAAAHLDVDLTIGTLTEADFDRFVRRMVDIYDEPFADVGSIPQMLVAEIAGKELRVVLSGDGGDELFGGYSRYQLAQRADALGLFPPLAVSALARLSRISGRGSSDILDRIGDETRASGVGYAALQILQSQQDASSYLAIDSHGPSTYAPRSGGIRAIRRDASLSYAMCIDRSQYLPADVLVKVDRATMAESIEARVPLLSAPMARLADIMPPSVKIKDGIGKWPLKELLRRRGFRDEFIHRQKMGFTIPLDSWLRRSIVRNADFEDLLRNPPELMCASETSAAVDRLLAGENNGQVVWTLLILSSWLTRYG